MTFETRAHALIADHALRGEGQDPLETLNAFLREEGFDLLMAREIRNPFEEDFDDALEVYDGPEELRARWMRRRAALHDAGMVRSRRIDTPILWSELKKHARGPALTVFQDLADFGMIEGVSMPFHPIDRPPFLISIAGDAAARMSEQDLLTLQLVVTHFFVLWLSEQPTRHADIDYLSPREIEILSASGAGMKGSVIERELGISPHTMRTHLRSIRTKLRARSVAHAVQIALRHGIIAA